MRCATLEEEYRLRCRTPSSINLHLPILKTLVGEAKEWLGRRPIVKEFGMRMGDSTVALLASGEADRLYSYDVCPQMEEIKHIGGLVSDCVPGSTEFLFRQENILDAIPSPCDIILEDSLHVGDHLRRVLERHGDSVTTFIIFHDVVQFGMVDEVDLSLVDGGKFLPAPQGYVPGLLPAILDFMATGPWEVYYYSPENNGLLVIRRRE